MASSSGIGKSRTVFISATVLLVGTWSLISFFMLAATEGWLVPWDCVHVSLRPQLGNWERAINDFFEGPPGSFLPALGFTHLPDLERATGMAYDSQSGATVNVLASGGSVLLLVAESVDLLSVSGGSDEMYQLTLDRGTIVLWNVVFRLAVTIFVVSLGLLCFAIAKKKSWLLSSVAGLILVSSLVAIFHITLSPYSYYRKKIEPSIAIGEEVFKRYQDYRKEHGQYPDSIGEIYFAELDYFNVIVGLRQDLTRCDGFGVGCRGLKVTLEDGEPVVIVHDELVQCDIDNLTRNWECWDHR